MNFFSCPILCENAPKSTPILGAYDFAVWRLFKNSIRSTHINVSEKDMDRYLKEFTFWSNYRGMVKAMFDLLIAAV